MSDPPRPIDPDRLLEQLSWLRDLALHLVRDPDRADDLCQETVLAALRAPHGPRGSLRSWLAAVLRRRAARERRSGARRARRERPRRQVTLSPFLIAKYEVSQAEWYRVMGTRPSFDKGDGLPVTLVSWVDCQEFCRRTGLSLPTEAQWEYACRAGTPAAFSWGADLLETQANLSGTTTLRVDALDPNGFGLHQMHGNVSEWCEDEYDPAFYGRPESVRGDPRCGLPYDQRRRRDYFRLESPRRVTRGGHHTASSPSDGKSYCRSASRNFRSPGWAEGALGFRPVRSLGEGGLRSIEELERAMEEGQRWEDLRQDIAARVDAKDVKVARLIGRYLDRGEATALELEGALGALRRIDPQAAGVVARRFLTGDDAGLRIQAARALLGTGERSLALPVLEDVFRRLRDPDLSEYAVADAVDGLLAEGSPESRRTIETLLTGDGFGTGLKRARARIVHSLARAGLPGGLQYYRRLLDVDGNRLGGARFAEGVSVAHAFASEIVEHYAPLDPEVSSVREATDFKSPERIAALKDWLDRQIAAVK